MCALNVTFMQKFCSLCLESMEDNTDKEGDEVNYMLNQFKDGYYYALEIIQSEMHHNIERAKCLK